MLVELNASATPFPIERSACSAPHLSASPSRTADYEEAKKIVDKWERQRHAPADEQRIVTITEAVQAYLSDAEARNLAEDTRKKLATIFEKQLIAWASARGYIRP